MDENEKKLRRQIENRLRTDRVALHAVAKLLCMEGDNANLSVDKR